MSKISGQLLISGQFQDNCEISGQLGALHSPFSLQHLYICKASVALILHIFTRQYSTHNVGKTYLSLANSWYKVISNAFHFIETWISFTHVIRLCNDRANRINANNLESTEQIQVNYFNNLHNELIVPY